ncbi:MAG: dUTP pyrophosphatase [Actinomycetota bacterium]|jgi:dUTP pyrophosphatase|nr:dUTP pyrophosphatase [Actinomycetota bacterium]
MKLPVHRLDPGLPLPAYAHPGDAGLDLYAAEDVSLAPGDRIAIPTGIAVAIPKGYAGFVHARSGRALKQGLALVNAPGLIDSGYRGEIKVIVINLARKHTVQIRRAEKIAQLVVQKVTPVELTEVDGLAPSARGEGGFGSTGS